MAQLAVVLLALFGQTERTYILERAAHARAVATAKGRRIGRPPVVDADKLAYAAHLRDADHSIAEIVAKSGIPRTLPTRPETRQRRSSAWDPAVVDVFDKAGNPIVTVADWEERAGPVSPDQWRDGYSAKELAKAWAPGNGGSAAAEITALLRLALEDEGLEVVRGIPEQRTRFDANPRGPRVHDLLVQALGAAGPIVIGVEGRGHESSGKPLGAHLAAAGLGHARPR